MCPHEQCDRHPPPGKRVRESIEHNFVYLSLDGKNNKIINARRLKRSGVCGFALRSRFAFGWRFDSWEGDGDASEHSVILVLVVSLLHFFNLSGV
jgi:hypothetical protein